ncbi:NADPH--cytochrome P450 reductase [Fusarium oxysporum f. sp. cubense race 1]|uniref:NADPH--cytochrome P450 reductase n=1 Tax=Fusarium oxysporum f. sp. cubense (strain race 1) TaxID=1229664 RepID=N4USH2_FUSC1|nr:NADPH--cytochrome P450 reductase [Fusarium oxysporum f. sp. cubense race 1]
MADIDIMTNESILDEALLTTESPVIDSTDLIVLLSLLLGAIVYLSNGKLRNLFFPKPTTSAETTVSKEDSLRSISHICNSTGKNCIIFYGSQTGTAENYAQKLAREASSRYGLDPMVADLEEYDYNDLSELSKQVVLMFVLATYGEGEPTDNAQDFYTYITGGEDGDQPDADLQNVKYVAFGLGNSTYEHYNAMVRRVSKALDQLGAKNLASVGEADDAAGTTEEDFLAWKQDMWPKLVQEFGLQERDVAYESTFGVLERDDLSASSPGVFLGEANADHLDTSSGNRQFSNTNPYIAKITESRELFTSEDRNCIHMEIDLGDSSLSYETGDHIAIWPTNSEDQVAQLLNILELTEKKDTVISIVSREATAKSPVPTPTTYAAALRYYLEIAGPVSREFINVIAAFAPTEIAKVEATKLGSDKVYFHEKISQKCLSLAQVLSTLSGGQPWPKLPFSAIVEGLSKLQPRYYSISSSSLVQPSLVSITAAVESAEIQGRPDVFKGVATNYLLSLKQAQNQESQSQEHQLDGPREKYTGFKTPIHLRKSNFKLPKDSSRPVIMVGPGTGVAPFRGFLQERAALKKQGKKVGKSLLFFGCRRRDEDYLYESEWQEHKNTLGDSFDIHAAFSRETKQKVYVQHLIKSYANDVIDMIDNGAIVYVCGDAKHMARDVNSTLISIWAEQRNISVESATEKVKGLRDTARYQVSISHLRLKPLLTSRRRISGRYSSVAASVDNMRSS